PRDPRDRGRDRENAARSEGRRAPGRGTRAAGGAGGRGGGGRRRGRGDEEPDDRPWIKRFLSKAWKPALVTFGLMVIGGVAAFAIMYAQAPDVRDLDEKAETQMSATQIMWAAEGDEQPEVAVTTGDVQRIEVKYDDIPPSVINGVLAAEQRTFFTDPGISVSGIARAVVSGGEAGGGSTITQQMARNYYSDLESSNRYIRKVREIFIAIKLNQQMSHEKILETYLNTIYFGRGASGIEMASRAYFDKSVGELNDAEGAFLGLIIQMPSNFEGEMGEWTEKYLKDERWPYMQEQLALMHEEDPGLGLPREKAEALEIPELVPYGAGAEGEEQEPDPKFGYVRQAVIDEIKERYAGSGITDADIATKGLVVHTSLDPELMDAARNSFGVLPDTPEDTMMGLTAIDPATGEIIAFHGGDSVVEDVNNSLVHRTQAGSSYKPYVLATALENDISLRSTFDGDSPQEFPGLADEVKNAGGRSYGDVDLVRSTADSINTPFVKLASELGAANVDALAVRAGVDEEQTTTSTQGPLVALGTHQVSTLDQATGYSTFAAGGKHRPAHMVTELRTADGEVIPPDDADKLESGEQVLSEDVAADVTYAMTQVVENGGGTEAALPGHPVAGKTGTSTDAVSAWFVGYTPQLVAAVGLSRKDANDPLQFDGQTADQIFGGTTSAKVWREFMMTAMEGVQPGQFPPPKYVGTEQSFVPTPSPSAEPSDEVSEEPSDEPSDQESATDCDPERPGDQQGQECASDEPTDPEPCGGWWEPECEESPGPGGPQECQRPNAPEHCESTEPTDGPTTGGDQGEEGDGGLLRSNSGGGSESNRKVVLSRED
ncbi:transglycosylase domain-containing protein, partial [Nocardiopsis sp. NPDC060348]